ncbi:MAG: SAF domain-containing protein [Burkholderiaceae bacterium]|nr:SAF domain-containing protein [Microbacteriaceae bacterium]
MKRPSARGEHPPRSVWFDPRFGIGILLVAASIAGVAWTVSATTRTVQVWVARPALAPGDAVTADDLTLASVLLGSAASAYLEEDDLDGTVVVTRPIGAGELVPVASLGTADGVHVASVVVTTQSELPRAVQEGAMVDLWCATPVEGGGYGPPAVLAPSALVARVVERDGLIAGGQGTAVEVLVARDRVAEVLAAIDNEGAMSLVPVAVPVGG